jgi:hypothetical protein
MTLNAVLIDVATGERLEVITDILGHPNLAVSDHYADSTQFKSATRSSAGTTTIASPKTDGALLLTDMIISTDRVANSRLTVEFNCGTHQINIYDGYANDAPINFAIGFHGGWTGWKNAALEMTTLQAIKATVAIGYIKVPSGIEYEVWDEMR